MNPMLTRFPESVRIDGVRYPLNTDFRVGLRIMSAYEDPHLSGKWCFAACSIRSSRRILPRRSGREFASWMAGNSPGRPAAGGFTALTRTGHTSIRQSCRPTG